MKEMTIQLNSIDDVKDFVRVTSQFATDLDLVSDRYVIDAKSILGIFSVDLSRPVKLRVESDSEAPRIEEALRKYIVAD